MGHTTHSGMRTPPVCLLTEGGKFCFFFTVTFALVKPSVARWFLFATEPRYIQMTYFYEFEKFKVTETCTSSCKYP